MSPIIRSRGDQGFGMILVIGTLGLISAVIATALLIGITALRQSSQRVTYEQALAAAENGIDFSLAKLQRAFDQYNADYPIPSPANALVQPTPTCNASVVPEPSTAVTADPVAERTWAKAQLNALRTAHPECVQTGGEGEWIVLKPETALVGGLYPKYGRIYALGAVPAFDDNNSKTRLLKTEYIFMPYRPTHALLTGASLALDSSTKVTSAFGVDPALAAVHTNGSLSEDGNPTVYGVVTSTGTSTGSSSNNFLANPGGTVINKPPETIPTVSARSVYFQNLSKTALQGVWFDLCNDGTARPRSPGGPCTSATVLGSGVAPSNFRGWEWNSSSTTWIATRNAQDGVYFVHWANVDVAPGNGTFNNFTVIAEAKNPESCTTKQFGNINWDHYGLLAPAMPSLFFLADADLKTSSNFFAGQGTTSTPVISGMFVAGDQIDMSTSSQGAVGAVLAGDQCTNSALATSNSVKNPEIYFDPNTEAPFTSLINTTLWLEYVG